MRPSRLRVVGLTIRPLQVLYYKTEFPARPVLYGVSSVRPRCHWPTPIVRYCALVSLCSGSDLGPVLGIFRTLSVVCRSAFTPFTACGMVPSSAVYAVNPGTFPRITGYLSLFPPFLISPFVLSFFLGFPYLSRYHHSFWFSPLHVYRVPSSVIRPTCLHTEYKQGALSLYLPHQGAGPGHPCVPPILVDCSTPTAIKFSLIQST